MSDRISRRIVASALLAGCLGLLPATVGATAARPSGSRQAAVASNSPVGSLWLQLVRLVAGDTTGNTNPSNPGRPPVHNDEGPGLCPHGH